MKKNKCSTVCFDFRIVFFAQFFCLQIGNISTCQCKKGVTGSQGQGSCLKEVAKDGATTYLVSLSDNEVDYAQFMCQQGGADLASFLNLPNSRREKVWAMVEESGWSTTWVGKYFANKTVAVDCKKPILKLWCSSTYSLCERRIEETICSSESECAVDATCNYSEYVDTQTGLLKTFSQKTCTCDPGYYGNGSVCIDALMYELPTTPPPWWQLG